AGMSGRSFSERLTELIIHGLVHILGFDHEKGEKEARRMRYRERKLLRFLSEQEFCGELFLEKRP
ncbi:MAG TPA: rRNA maturation RNAse YbeY, partial [Syntrophorhabdaceae bacterium]|nr:rRNA maturation RNAse YbeY [Syntrophorhabdaceae bacterium]